MLSKKLILTISLICISILQFTVIAQKATAKVTIQPVEIAIGQQSTISLEVVAPKGRKLTMPVYQDTLITGIEIISMPKADTAYVNDAITITQHYVVSSFDSAFYQIPYMLVMDGAEAIQSNPFELKVTSPMLTDVTKSYLEEITKAETDSLNLEKMGVYDVKNVQTPDVLWQDYLLLGLAILSLLLLIIAGIYGIYIYKQKQARGYFFTPPVVDPPHVLAINALNQVKAEKIWSQGRQKEYYTQVTDILRQYVEKRFYVTAFEMTSDEILTIIENYIEANSSTDSLRQVLKTADLVKFAKYTPSSDENDLSLVNSILFVNQTKKEEVVEKPVESIVAPVATVKTGADDDPNEPIDWSIPENQMIDAPDEVAVPDNKVIEQSPQEPVSQSKEPKPTPPQLTEELQAYAPKPLGLVEPTSDKEDRNRSAGGSSNRISNISRIDSTNNITINRGFNDTIENKDSGSTNSSSINKYKI
ncbi:MAG: hypothetical protein RL662_955 [Bacteroidota bacterium]|jgi:hypothetical protein